MPKMRSANVMQELCGGGAVFRLVQNTLKLPQHDDPKLASVVNRLKSKVLCGEAKWEWI
ncbi:hypothetical protein HanXRQr2_Chr01g0020011 [Helianthus annuus]|uniref:Uncharacterized protein n=1 Tax=Helianthus annuus TaxID=4232 RepID=A0A251VMT1_HELAN|nr:hypothetical protein HanXRQr2_Chr01g0020011 [Helianthus annuus]